MRRSSISLLIITVAIIFAAAVVGPHRLSAGGITGVQWKQIGPAPIQDSSGAGQINVPGGSESGLVTDIAIDPTGTTDQTIFIATQNGGVWKSTDGGMTWAPKTDFLPAISIGAVALDQSNPSNVYAGTGSLFIGNGIQDFNSAGVYKSTDGGDTWTVLNPEGVFTGLGVNRMVLPNSSTLLVGTSGGLFRSPDGGGSFSLTLSGVISDLKLDTQNSNTVYAASAGLGIYKSTDGGKTFPTLLFSNLSSGISAGQAFDGITFAQSTNDGGKTFYVAAILSAGTPFVVCNPAKYANTISVYTSKDGGMTWKEIQQGDELTASLQKSGVAGHTLGYDATIGVDPQNANTYYYGLRGLFAATDGGTGGLRDLVASANPNVMCLDTTGQDNRIDNNKGHSDHHALYFSPASHFSGTPTRAYFGNDGGLTSSNDLTCSGSPLACTANFSYLNNGIGTILMTWFDIGRGSAGNNAYSYGTAQDNGLFSHTPAQTGLNWIAGSDSDGTAVAVDPLNPQHALGSGNTYLSTTDGVNWSAPAGAQPSGGARPIVFDPNGGAAYAANGPKFFQSTDNGSTFPNTNTFAQGITAIAQSKIDSNTIWVGFGDGTVQFTNNALPGPPTWKSPATQPGGITGQGIQELAVDPANAAQVVAVFAGFSNVPDATKTPSQHVWMTSDNGATWKDISGVVNGGLTNLPDLPLHSVVIDPSTSPHTIIVGGDGGVFQSADQGTTWQRLGLGLPNAQVQMLALDTSTELLRAGTYGRSAFELGPATGPLLTINSTFNFGTLCPGQTPTELLQLFNVGSSDLTISSISPVSPSPDFAVSGPSFPVKIAAGEELDYTVSYTPLLANEGVTETVTFQIDSNDVVNPSQQVTYTATVGQPNGSTVIANGGAFGNVCVGSMADLNLTIANSGTCPLLVSNIVSSDPDFLPPSTLFYPLSIQQGNSLSAPVAFQPLSTGTKSGIITVDSSNNLTGNMSVNVSGSAPPGNITVSGSGAFGNVCAGSNAQQTITVANTGPCNLHVTSATISCPDFTIEGNPFPATISADASLPLTIQFTPTSSGPKSCTLTITSDSGGTPGTVTMVNLTAATPAANLNVPSSESFPPTVIQSVGACSSQLPYVVSNDGTCPVVVDSVLPSGDYSLSGLPSLPTAVAGNNGQLGAGDLNALFKPNTIERADQGTITVTYETDPIKHTTTTATTNLCGEGTSRGARVLVTSGGVPLASVDQIQLHRVGSNRKGISIDNVKNAPLQTVTQTAPCASFQFQREWGGVTNPIQLTAGDYQITVNARVNGKKVSQTISFTLGTCDFDQNIVVAF